MNLETFCVPEAALWRVCRLRAAQRQYTPRLQLRLSASFFSVTCGSLCGRALDFRGHQSAACAVVEGLGREGGREGGVAAESAGARVCREDGGGVTTINIRSTSPCQPCPQTSRGDPVDGAKLAVDTTFASALGRNGVPCLHCADRMHTARRSIDISNVLVARAEHHSWF